MDDEEGFTNFGFSFQVFVAVVYPEIRNYQEAVDRLRGDVGNFMGDGGETSFSVGYERVMNNAPLAVNPPDPQPKGTRPRVFGWIADGTEEVVTNLNNSPLPAGSLGSGRPYGAMTNGTTSTGLPLNPPKRGGAKAEVLGHVTNSFFFRRTRISRGGGRGKKSGTPTRNCRKAKKDAEIHVVNVDKKSAAGAYKTTV